MRNHSVGMSSVDRTWPRGLSRRDWFGQTLAGALGAELLAGRTYATEFADDGGDAGEIANVKALGAKAGLEAFVQTPSAHFLGLGNADLSYCKNALTRCEALATAFLSHFGDRGFKLARPQKRMTVITLKDAASYRALLGDNPGAAVGGHYEPDTNRLVVFDFRATDGKAEGDPAVENPERVNLFALIHEGIHMLSYNTGLLGRQMDVPACISEGLATYGELWRPKGKWKIGAINGPRVNAIVDPQGGAGKWIPIGQLLTGDALFNQPGMEQLAYGQAWVLVHYLLQRGPQQLPKFRAYLSKIPAPAGADKRLKVAEAELGSLKALDDVLKRHALAQLRKAK